MLKAFENRNPLSMILSTQEEEEEEHGIGIFYYAERLLPRNHLPTLWFWENYLQVIRYVYALRYWTIVFISYHLILKML